MTRLAPDFNVGTTATAALPPAPPRARIISAIHPHGSGPRLHCRPPSLPHCACLCIGHHLCVGPRLLLGTLLRFGSAP